MANIELTWDATQMSGATDIESVQIWSVDGDQTGSYTQTNGQISAADAATFVSSASVVQQGLSTTDTTHTQNDVTNPGGGITWGVFSYNSAGYGPGSIFHLDF